VYCLCVWLGTDCLCPYGETNSIFELILATDIFFYLNANFTLIFNLYKRLQLLGTKFPWPPTGAPPLDSAGDSQTTCCVPPTVETDRRLRPKVIIFIEFLRWYLDICPGVEMCESATEGAPPEFADLNPPQQCDESMPPYKIIKPIYDGHFTERFPQLDAVSSARILVSYFS